MPQIENVTEARAALRVFAVRLSEPLPEAGDSLVDIMLKLYRVVKSDLQPKGIFC
jgi:hypothetical protein